MNKNDQFEFKRLLGTTCFLIKFQATFLIGCS